MEKIRCLEKNQEKIARLKKMIRRAVIFRDEVNLEELKYRFFLKKMVDCGDRGCFIGEIEK